jgi:hypothetical protein
VARRVRRLDAHGLRGEVDLNEDYTQNKDATRKERYLERHRRNENWSDYKSAGALSWWILWNKPSLRASLADYKRRFGL